MKLLHFKLPMMALALLMMPSMAFASGNLDASDFTGMSFWLISMALVASTVFFLIERDRVAAKWKTSLTVSGLVTLIAAVHYFYMRDVWVSTGTSPTEFRYIDWLLTVPLLMVEFFLILSAIAKVPSGVFWRLFIFHNLDVDLRLSGRVWQNECHGWFCSRYDCLVCCSV